MVLVAAAVFMASMLGLALPSQGAEVLAVPILLFGGLLLLVHPVFGMLLIAATIPLENLVMFGDEQVTLTRILGTVVFGAWLSRKLLLRESLESVLSTRFFRVTVVLLALALASGLWATYTLDVFSGVYTLFQLFLWSLLVIALANTWDRIEWLAKALVMAGLVTAILTIQQYLTGNVFTGRAGEGIAGGFNNTAQILVTIVPFAFYLIRARLGWQWGLVSALCVILSLFAVALTFSRMGFIMLTLILFVEYWETIRAHTGRGLLVLITGLTLVIAVAVFHKSEVGERLQRRAQSIAPYLQESIGQNDTGYLSARGYHTRVGLAIFQDHPLLGAGYDNYRRLFLSVYQFRVPGSDSIYGSPRSPHGTYVGFLADLGIVGFALWIGVLGIVLRNLHVAWSILSKTRPSKHYLLVRAVTYAFLLQVAYAWYANVHLEKLVWLLLGLSVAVRLLADQRDWSQAPVHTRDFSIYGETK